MSSKRPKSTTSQQSTPEKKARVSQEPKTPHGEATPQKKKDMEQKSPKSEDGMSSQGSQSTPTKQLKTPDKTILTYSFFEPVQGKQIAVVGDTIEEIKIQDVKPGEVMGKILRVRVSCKQQAREDLEEQQAKINNVYTLRNFAVKREAKNFEREGTTNFEILLKESSILEDAEATSDVAKINFAPIPIDNISGHDLDTKLDALGILVMKGEMMKLIAKGKPTSKLEIAIADKSEKTISLALWGPTAERFESELYVPVAVRKAQVKQYTGITFLNASFNTTIWPNPEVEGVEELKIWFEKKRLEMGL